MRLMGTAVATAALGLGLALSPAQAVEFGFANITNNTAVNLSPQLSVDVTAAGGAGGNLQFVFTNNVGIASNISEIYFDWAPDNLFVLANTAITSETRGRLYGRRRPPRRWLARRQHYYVQ